jgi:hypothetical protein
VTLRVALALALGSAGALACASDTGDEAEAVPVCAPLVLLAPLPDPGACDDAELASYRDAISATGIEERHRALVRVAFDESARPGEVCVQSQVGSDLWTGARRVGTRLDALRAAPAGPACLAGRRLDFNRYDARFAEIEQARVLCERQVGRRSSALRECLQFQSDWIVIGLPRSTRPAIFVKPEVPDPPGPPVVDTMNRCTRTERGLRFERMGACIQQDGFELLLPPTR